MNASEGDIILLAFWATGLAAILFVSVPVVLVVISGRRKRRPQGRGSTRTIPVLVAVWLASLCWLLVVAYFLSTFKMTRLF